MSIEVMIKERHETRHRTTIPMFGCDILSHAKVLGDGGGIISHNSQRHVFCKLHTSTDLPAESYSILI